MTNIGQNISILSNEVFTKPFDKASVREDLAKRISWNQSEFRLEGATLVVIVDQPATSGADLQISVNGKRQETVRWEAFDTEEKKIETDVLADMINGINDFTFLYNAPNHVFQAAEVQVDVTLMLSFRPLKVDSNDNTPADEGGLKDNAFFEKIANGVKQHAKLLLVVAVVTGAAITVAKFWDQLTGVKGISRVANFIRR